MHFPRACMAIPLDTGAILSCCMRPARYMAASKVLTGSCDAVALSCYEYSNHHELRAVQVAARFNWLYHDTATYAPYTIETAHVPSLLLGRKCAQGPHRMHYIVVQPTASNPAHLQ